ncbi:hypothetical protein P3X46_031852 [Hevea brasiliensis]|uniref:RING-type E3 ubiquitin transferase n=1 Tax=Hevea brasiliensis TaxID=3981 RepID=A0ABQ9KND5_HEVBR|nr:uncharacterized protein LOC110659326 [Hevea brasiliensis]KAJ9141304.1 hypothetical protein P3X46_031852 [Hevea brasiliensis]
MSTFFSSSLFEIPHPTRYRYRVSLSSPQENQDNDQFSRSAMITLIFRRFDVYQRYERSLNVLLPELPVPREQRFVHVPACDYGESEEGPECEIMTAMGIPPNVVNLVGTEVRRACSGTDVSIFADIYIAQIHQLVAYDDDGDDDDDYDSNPLMEDVGTIPASKASIDGLTRRRFHRRSHDPGVTCVVCLEELEEDDDLIELPCSHLYHEDCIVKWLLSSHLCPLCRHQMPTEQPRLCPY